MGECQRVTVRVLDVYHESSKDAQLSMKLRSSFSTENVLVFGFEYSNFLCNLSTVSSFSLKYIGCTLKEEQPLRLLLNLFFYSSNCSEPT